jgi:hypothetical protein
VRFSLASTRAVERGVLRITTGNTGFRGDLALLPDGNIIDVVPRREPGQLTSGVDLQLTARDGRVLRTTRVRTPPSDSLDVVMVPFITQGGRGFNYFYPPHGATALFALARSGDFAIGISSRYALSVHAPDGALRHIIRREDAERPPLSHAERSSAEKSVKENADASGGRARFNVPSRKQPVRSIAFDEDGRLWVERSVADGADRVADVYDRTGRLAEVRRWPAGASIVDGFLGRDIAVGVQTDSLGVPNVVRVRFRR